MKAHWMMIMLAALPLGGLSGCDTEEPATPGSMPVAWRYAYDVADGPALQPQVFGDSLVLFSAEARLHAVRTHDGTRKWRTEPLTDPQDELLAYDLVVDGERVIGTHLGRAIAWNLHDGQQRWTFHPPAGQRFFDAGRYDVGGGYYFAGGSGGYLYGVRKDDGVLAYTRTLDYLPGIIDHRDGILYIAQAWTPDDGQGKSQGAIVAMRADTGEILWRFHTDQGGFYDIRPHIDGSRLYSGTREGAGAFFALDVTTGAEIWRNTEAPAFAATYSSDKIFVNDASRLRALDKQAGRTLWVADLQAGASTMARPAYYEGYVYHPHAGRLFVVEAETGRVAHVETTPTPVWELNVGDGKILAQTVSELIAYEPYSD